MLVSYQFSSGYHKRMRKQVSVGVAAAGMAFGAQNVNVTGTLDPGTQGVMSEGAELYCPTCAKAVPDPLVCGDCHAVICRVCGTPLERIDELGIG